MSPKMDAVPTFVDNYHNKDEIALVRYNNLGETGLKLSHLSIGGGVFSHLYGLKEEADAIEVVQKGIKMGLNYIDTAPWYGQGSSEEILSKALKDVPREAYYIGTKVGRYEVQFERMFDFSASKTASSIDNSLNKLGLDYVDIIQVHDVEFAPSIDIILNETLPELQKAVDAKKAHFIGITGYNIKVLKEIVLKSKVKISSILSYSRCTLIDDDLSQYIEFFHSRGIGVICAAAPAMGLLTNQGPQPWHPAQDEQKLICKEAGQYCESQNVELGRLAVWHTLNKPGIDTNLVGMISKDQLDANFDVMVKGLKPQEHNVLEEINTRYFANANDWNWEGKEVKNYWEQINKTK